MIEKILIPRNKDTSKLLEKDIVGWVGSVSDLKATVNDFREIKNRIIVDELAVIKAIHVDRLNKGDVTIDEFLETLDKQIKKFLSEVHLILILHDGLEEPRDIPDEEIDDELEKLPINRIKAFELKVSYSHFDSNSGNSTRIWLKASKQSAIISVYSNFDNFKYLDWLAKRLKFTKPKLSWAKSKKFKALTVFFLIMDIVVAYCLVHNSFSAQIRELIFMAIPLLVTAIFWIMSKLFNLLNPRFEIYPNDKNYTLARISTIIVYILGTIVIPVLAILLPILIPNKN